MNIIATITDNKINLEAYADRINQGRTDSVSFYVNDRNVSVSYTYGQLSEDAQMKEINWFLQGRTFTTNKY